MAAVVSYLLLSLPALRVAVGGAAVAAAGVAAGAASERWLWPGEGEEPRRRWRRAAEGRRTGRLRRPRSRDCDAYWALAGANDCDVARCEAFLTTIARWPRDVWLAIDGAAAESPNARDAERSLAALVSESELQVTAWLVRDQVETMAAMAGSGAVARRTPPTALASSEYRALASAREIVGRAALAHLLRPRLAPDVYAALTTPVAIVPIPSPPSPYAPL